MKSSAPTLPTAARIAALLLLATTPAGATSFVMVGDEVLADQAPVIAEVRVLSVDERAGASEPLSEYRMAVERLIAGYVPASPLAVRVRGGLLPDGMRLHVYGAPRFEEGGRALLFLKPRPDGTYRILHFLLGAFHVVEIEGERYAVRSLTEAVEVELPAKATVRRGPRRLESFRGWLQDRARGIQRPADYFVAVGASSDRIEKYALLRSSSSGRPIRWRTFDTGGTVRWWAHEDGQPGLAGGGIGHFRTALAAWTNDPSTPIRLAYEGTNTRRSGLSSSDGVNTILFDDNGTTSEFDEIFSCATGGVIAVGGPWFFPDSTHTHNGTVFHPAGEGDIVTNKNTGCYLSEGKVAEEVFAHELGHTLGLGHSCDLDGAPSCSSAALNNALMRAQAHGGNFGAKLTSDDRAGIRFLYGQPLQAPAAPSNLSATAISSNRIDLAWSDNSSQETSYEIERRTGGGSYQRIAVRGANSTSYQDTAVSSGTGYTYRVRALNSAGASGYSNTASVTALGEAAPTDLTASGLSGSEIRLVWQDNAASETGYEVEGKSGGGDYSLLETVGANSTSTIAGGLSAATSYTFRVRATGGLGNSSYSSPASATTFFPDPEPCVAGPSTLCLNDDRFEVEVTWRDFAGAFGPATDVELPSGDSGLLWFFTDNNWEMLIKVLDGCAINDRFWVFAAATTDVEYTLTVTDSWTGFTRTYSNGLGVASPAITDTDAFATCSAPGPDLLHGPPAAPPGKAVEPPAAVVTAAAAGGEKEGGCMPGDSTLCLNDDRFRVEIVWRDFVDQLGSGRVDPFQGTDSGLLYFFDSQNLEVLVKVLEACAINGRFWVFAAATTDVEYTMTVTDTETGLEKQYFNPLGNAADAITDTDAFVCP